MSEGEEHKYKKWGRKELDFLKGNYKDLSDKEIAKELNRTIWSVKNKRVRDGLKKETRWSEEEVNFLKSNYKDMTAKEIADKLGRTEWAIRGKVREMGLKKVKKRTKDEKKFLKKNYPVMENKEIAKKLGRPPYQIRVMASSLGLKKKKLRINSKQREVIEGCLLGDGGLYIARKNAHFYYGSIKQGHTDFISGVLDDVNLEHNTSYNFENSEFQLRTPVSPTLTKMYNNWYENNKKCKISKEFELTPIKLLLWYIGDGSYQSKINRCRIYTKNFNKKRIKNLISQLDFKLRIYEKEHHKGGKMYTIATIKESVDSFFEYINTKYGYPKCYNYKFQEKKNE